MRTRLLLPLAVLLLPVATGCQHAASASPPSQAVGQTPRLRGAARPARHAGRGDAGRQGEAGGRQHHDRARGPAPAGRDARSVRAVPRLPAAAGRPDAPEQRRRRRHEAAGARLGLRRRRGRARRHERPRGRRGGPREGASSSDDREFSAKVVGKDERLDVAVLQLENAPADLPVASLGKSDGLRVGEYVVAIGNPFGLGNTVTMGIVSAKGRSISAGPYDDFIQTDASINLGQQWRPALRSPRAGGRHQHGHQPERHGNRLRHSDRRQEARSCPSSCRRATSRAGASASSSRAWTRTSRRPWGSTGPTARWSRRSSRASWPGAAGARLGRRHPVGRRTSGRPLRGAAAPRGAAPPRHAGRSQASCNIARRAT